MVRAGLVLSAILLAAPALAQQQIVAEDAMNEQQKRGRDLFTQHCVVCHVRTLINSPANWGPPLSGNSLGGNVKTIAQVVGDGTPNMPGFKLNFTPAQIEDIASYVAAFPKPAQTSTQPPAAAPR